MAVNITAVIVITATFAITASSIITSITTAIEEERARDRGKQGRERGVRFELNVDIAMLESCH